jgi:hypothetical protein
MENNRDERMLKERLERCRQLAKDFPEGTTARNIKQLEEEILADLRALSR